MNERVQEQLQRAGAVALTGRVHGLGSSTVGRVAVGYLPVLAAIPMAIPVTNSERLQAMGMLHQVLARTTQVEIRTHRAVPPLARCDVPLTLVASVQVGRHRRVVKMEEKHHGRMLGPP